LLLEEQSRIERVIYRDFRKMSDEQTKLAYRCNFIMSRHPILRVPYGFAFKNATLRDTFEPVYARFFMILNITSWLLLILFFFLLNLV